MESLGQKLVIVGLCLVSILSFAADKVGDPQCPLSALNGASNDPLQREFETQISQYKETPNPAHLTSTREALQKILAESGPEAYEEAVTHLIRHLTKAQPHRYSALAEILAKEVNEGEGTALLVTRALQKGRHKRILQLMESQVKGPHQSQLLENALAKVEGRIPENAAGFATLPGETGRLLLTRIERSKNGESTDDVVSALEGIFQSHPQAIGEAIERTLESYSNPKHHGLATQVLSKLSDAAKAEAFKTVANNAEMLNQAFKTAARDPNDASLIATLIEMEVLAPESGFSVKLAEQLLADGFFENLVTLSSRLDQIPLRDAVPPRDFSFVDAIAKAIEKNPKEHNTAAFKLLKRLKAGGATETHSKLETALAALGIHPTPTKDPGTKKDKKVKPLPQTDVTNLLADFNANPNFITRRRLAKKLKRILAEDSTDKSAADVFSILEALVKAQKNDLGYQYFSHPTFAVSINGVKITPMSQSNIHEVTAELVKEFPGEAKRIIDISTSSRYANVPQLRKLKSQVDALHGNLLKQETSTPEELDGLQQASLSLKEKIGRMERQSIPRRLARAALSDVLRPAEPEPGKTRQDFNMGYNTGNSMLSGRSKLTLFALALGGAGVIKVLVDRWGDWDTKVEPVEPITPDEVEELRKKAAAWDLYMESIRNTQLPGEAVASPGPSKD